MIARYILIVLTLGLSLISANVGPELGKLFKAGERYFPDRYTESGCKAHKTDLEVSYMEAVKVPGFQSFLNNFLCSLQNVLADYSEDGRES